MPFVLLHGDLEDGFVVHGPFKSHQHAISFGEDEGYANYQILGMHEPVRKPLSVVKDPESHEAAPGEAQMRMGSSDGWGPAKVTIEALQDGAHLEFEAEKIWTSQERGYKPVYGPDGNPTDFEPTGQERLHIRAWKGMHAWDEFQAVKRG